jgi:hypothetical protein
VGVQVAVTRLGRHAVGIFVAALVAWFWNANVLAVAGGVSFASAIRGIFYLRHARTMSPWMLRWGFWSCVARVLGGLLSLLAVLGVNGVLRMNEDLVLACFWFGCIGTCGGMLAMMYALLAALHEMQNHMTDETWADLLEPSTQTSSSENEGATSE